MTGGSQVTKMLQPFRVEHEKSFSTLREAPYLTCLLSNREQLSSSLLFPLRSSRLSLLDVVFIMLINVKMPDVGILTFISMKNFMLS